MKNINKRSDARSYSPLSFLANSSMTKANRPENIKNRFLPPDVIGTWSLKPINTGSQPKNTVSCNYKRSRKKKASTNLNNTISHDDTQDDSFCNETPANMSYIDIRSNKNISQNRDLFQGTMKEKGSKSREIKNENIGFNVDKRYYSNIKTMLFQQGSQQQMLDRLISNKRGRSSSKKEDSSFNLSMISREKNNFPAFIPPKKQQERVKICPKLTPVKNKTKEEIRNEKLTLIEKTYSLSPHKTKNSSKSPKILDATNLDKSIVHTTSKKNKLNKTDEKFYQMKSPLEATRQRTTSKDAREKNLQPLPRYRTPKVSGQTQSPTDYRYSKDTSSILLRKDESWAKNSVRTNTSQVKVVTENTSRNNKDLLSVSSIVQCHSRTPMDNNTSMLSKDDEYSSHMFHSISKQISQSSNRDFNNVNPSGASEKAYAKPTPAKRGRKFKTEVNFNQRCYTVSNNSISNIFESAEIAEMNSQRHMSIGGRLSTMENEADKSYEIYQQTESGVYTPNKHTLKPPKDEFTPLMRQESFENALDEFAEKSVQVSVQDHNQSFALSSMGKAQFDELLGASLISYLNDKGTVQDHASKKEIETTLSISKHPVFKRSRVFVSKGINSTDKDGLQMISTNANSKATYKNDSVQLKSVKEEFFQSEAGIEKNSVLEIDFNFGEDMKPFKGSNNVIGNQVSPSFPAQVPSQSKFSQKPLLDNQEIDILNKKHVIKKKNSYDLETLRVSDDEKSDKNSETRENQTPKVIRASLAQPMLFYSGNKMNKPGGLFRVEQSFNENPMNSLNSFGSGRNPGKVNNNGFEDSQS